MTDPTANPAAATAAASPFPEWPTVQVAAVNGLQIAYETFGRSSDPTILLVMGLGTQMIAWPDELCEALADAGFFVIRYDNRDAGLSTFIDAPAPSIADLLLRRNVAYSLDDLATDAFGLLDHLGIERAHVAGTSMGGMIAQTMALRHPERILTLCLSMTTTGSKRVGKPTAAVVRQMAATKPSTSRAAAMEDAVSSWRLLGTPSALDDVKIRELAGIAWDRNHDPDGRLRQLGAILAQPDRTAGLRQLRIPTLVVHGLEDPLVSVTGGLALAKAIPGATFIGHHGAGHDLPRSMWRELVRDLLDHIERSGAAASATASA
jgi:pimeloyl-ACP methyl ester carboxylesterase